METSSSTVRIILDKRSQKKDGSHPLKLMLTSDRKKNYIGIDIALTEDEWEKITNRTARGELKDVQIRIRAIETKAQTILDGLGDYTFDRFRNEFNGVSANVHIKKVGKSRLVYDLYETYMDELQQKGQAGTYNFYKTAKVSLGKFKATLYFEDVTPAFLRDYEQWMIDKSKSPTTIGMHLRTLRCIFNYAIELGIVKASFYPFGKRKYQVPASLNIKKALTRDEVTKIINYVPETIDTWEEKARDLWILSYLCNGMNIKDICNLTYERINGDRLTFVRQKTAKTNRGATKMIQVYLPPIAIKIIDTWGQKPVNPKSYIFPFYSEGLTPQRKITVSNQVTQNINKWMKQIGEKLELSVPVTTYTARHTFSTVLKRSGASIEFISESLGHSDLKVTQNYLDSFEDDFRKEMSLRLLG
jgi:integrase